MKSPKKLRFWHKWKLRRLFAAEDVLFEKEEVAPFGIDSSRRQAMPAAVVRATKTSQVQALLKWANRVKMPVTTRARGTNRVGAAVPVEGGVVLSTLKMDRILEIDERDFVAVVEPGVVTADLQKAAEAKGMFYPPDPASVGYSTIGGNVMTGAGGMRALKYGVTRDYVLGMEAVLPGGKIINTGCRAHKDVTGLDLTRLLCGSCGTLAVVTKLYIKLLPLPEASASVLACFGSFSEALEAGRKALTMGELPTALEYMDDVTVRAMEKSGNAPWPAGMGGALLVKLDGTRDGVDRNRARLNALLAEAGAVWTASGEGKGKGAGMDADDEEKLWEVRRTVSQSLFSLAPEKTGEDVAVPRGSIAAAVEGFREIGQQTGLTVACFGHMGDGNIHVNVLYDPADVRPMNLPQKAPAKQSAATDRNPAPEHVSEGAEMAGGAEIAEGAKIAGNADASKTQASPDVPEAAPEPQPLPAAERVEEAKKRIFALAVELGGTLSGEHGTGLTKKDYLETKLSRDELRLMARIRKVFDPKGILNPGKGW